MNSDAWKYEPKVWNTGNGWSYDEGGMDDLPRVVTQVIETGDILHDPIRNLIRTKVPGHWSLAPMYLVTEGRWSGYSDFTVTSTWDEVHVHQGGVDLHWDDMGAFMRSLADANPPEGHP